MIIFQEPKHRKRHETEKRQKERKTYPTNLASGIYRRGIMIIINANRKFVESESITIKP